MGTTTKGIMLSGVYMMLGIFTVSFNSNEEISSRSSSTVAKYSQAEQYARLGVSLASAYMANNSTRSSFATRSKNVSGVTVNYYGTTLVSNLSSQVTSSVDLTEMKKINDKTTEVVVGRVKVIAKFSYNGGRWRNAGIQTKYEHL